MLQSVAIPFPRPFITLVGLLALSLNVNCAGAFEPKPGLHTSARTGIRYYLSLPTGWTPNSTWPILVTIDGVGHTFERNFNDFTKARGDGPFIIVTPCVSSNGNDPADLRAVLEIVKEIQAACHGQPKFFITGFSAGGHLAWQCIFMHPELLNGAVLAAGNFRFRGLGNMSKAPERVSLPVHEFLGKQDGNQAPLARQWEDAIKLAHQNGFENLGLTGVPGAGHEAFPDQVIAFCTSVLSRNEGQSR